MLLRNSKIIKHVLVLLFFLLGSAYLTHPLIFHLDTYTPGTVDETYITWILNWDIHALTNNIFHLFDGNTYYPYHYPLSFSDLHLASALIAFIPVTLFEEPLMAYTINLYLSFALLGFCTYALVYFLTSDHASSITAGTVFSFSTYLLLKIGQLQVLTIYWIPLSMLCYFAYLKFRKFRYFLLMMFFFYMQFINSFLPAYFLLISLIVLSLYEIKKKKNTLKLLLNKRTIFVLIITFILSVPIIYPYYYTSNYFHYTRDIREAIHTANRPEYFFYGFGRSYLAPIFSSLFYKNPGPFLYDGYRGFISIALTFLVIIYAFFKKLKKPPKYFKLFTYLAICTYVISLGPAFQWGGKVIKDPFIIPLPYAILYYLVPGFKGLRNSGRWELFEIFSFCIASGLLLSYILKKGALKRWSINIFLCLLVFLEFTFPITYYSLPSRKDIPPVYHYLDTTPPNSTIVEFPIYNWDMFPYSLAENIRLYYSTINFRKTINGTGGFSPLPWQELIISLASEFPSKKAISRLEKLHINYIIVHEEEFDKLNKKGFTVKGITIPNALMVKNSLAQNNKIKYIITFNNDSVYEIIY